MQLYLIDSDVQYRDQLTECLIQCENQNITIHSFTTFDEFLKINFAVLEPVMMLIDIDYAKNEEFCDWWIINKIPISILCEEFISSESISLFENQLFNETDMSKFFLNRYQEINCLLENIKDNYLSQGEFISVKKSALTRVISFYFPYGDMTFSKMIENSVLQNTKPNVSTLIIHYDPFYRINERTQYNLSYIFSQVKRSGTNFSWLVDGIVRKISPNIHCLDGPLHMMDIEYLDMVLLEQLVNWLQTGSKYQRIILNFNGVHISKHVDKLFSISTYCALFSKNESIQMLILKQFQYKWHILNGESENLVKEMIL